MGVVSKAIVILFRTARTKRQVDSSSMSVSADLAHQFNFRILWATDSYFQVVHSESIMRPSKLLFEIFTYLSACQSINVMDLCTTLVASARVRKYCSASFLINYRATTKHQFFFVLKKQNTIFQMLDLNYKIFQRTKTRFVQAQNFLFMEPKAMWQFLRSIFKFSCFRFYWKRALCKNKFRTCINVAVKF